jgi:hypothetical protein
MNQEIKRVLTEVLLKVSCCIAFSKKSFLIVVTFGNAKSGNT